VKSSKFIIDFIPGEVECMRFPGQPYSFYKCLSWVRIRSDSRLIEGTFEKINDPFNDEKCKSHPDIALIISQQF
jgi:hypothetical protein